MLIIVFKKVLAEETGIVPDKTWIDLPQRITVEWKEGDQIDNTLFINYTPVYVCASGAEVNYIIRYLCYVPIAYQPDEKASSGKVVAEQFYHGEYARFIAEHLPRK